jgi:hypothetical protein
MYQGGLFSTQVSNQLKKAGFDYFRGVRGDGNCFYRSVAVGFITKIGMERTP